MKNYLDAPMNKSFFEKIIYAVWHTYDCEDYRIGSDEIGGSEAP